MGIPRLKIKFNYFSQSKIILLVLVIISWNISIANTTPSLPKHNISKLTSSSVRRNNTESNELFHWEDYSVLAAMLLISCAIGIFYGYCGEKQTTSDDFLLGGSTMGTFPTALSLAASFITAIELLGNPAEMYVSGAQFWMICVAFILVVPVSSTLYLPVFMKLRLTSCYEYLEIRFCKSIRVYASALYMIQMILYTAVAVYAPSIALSDVTGLNTYLAVTLVYVVCIFYASQGGMKAVIVTDSFQSAVLVGSLATVLALAVSQVGGLDLVWEHAHRTNRLHFFNMNPDPTIRHSLWSVVIGGTIYWTSMFCANQASVQKYLSVERIGQARVALWVSAVGLIMVYSINFITGAVLAMYYAGCDPVQVGEINAPDRLLPLYVMRRLGKLRGVPGFFVAGIFAASLGTVASALNSMAAIACQELANGLFGIKLSKNKGAVIARWVCMGCGALSFALVFVVERLGPMLELALSFNGIAGGISLGLFSLGMLFPWANSKGAAWGGGCGLVLAATAGCGAQLAGHSPQLSPADLDECSTFYNLTLNPLTTRENNEEAAFWLFRMSYLWYSGLGCVATLLIGLIVSIFTGITDPAKVPIDLISPVIIKLLNSLPAKVKKILRLPLRLSPDLRRSASVRPPSVVEPKDLQRRRRLSEMAGGVFYSEAYNDDGHDNLGLQISSEKPPQVERCHSTSF